MGNKPPNRSGPTASQKEPKLSATSRSVSPELRSKASRRSFDENESTSPGAPLYAILGFAGTGKSSIALRLSTNGFEAKTSLSRDDEMTPVFSFQPRTSDETSDVRLIVPTLNSDTYVVESPWFQRVTGVFIVVDLTDQDSFKDLEACQWFESIRRSQSTPVILLGNRCDEAADGSREVPRDTARAWAHRRFFPYFEVSAKTGKNLRKALEQMIILDKKARDGLPVRTMLTASESSDTSTRSRVS